MKTISIEEFKTNLSKFEKKILKGEEFVVTRGQKKKKTVKTRLYAEQKPKRRKLGILEGKVTAKFHDDWEMSDEEMLNS
jgi:antitoxin (DNA-binding transcriptional repressor) of toxin-antitoxin stability system